MTKPGNIRITLFYYRKWILEFIVIVILRTFHIKKKITTDLNHNKYVYKNRIILYSIYILIRLISICLQYGLKIDYATNFTNS